MDAADAVGWFACVSCTGSFAFQLRLTLIRWSAGDFSWIWLGMFLPGITGWGVQSLMTGNVPLGVANLIAACLLLPTLYVKFNHGRRPAWSVRWNQRVEAKAAA